MNSLKNIYSDVPQNPAGEIIETILQSTGFRVERIVSRGQCSPPDFWYDQDENEWVILLKGHAALRFEDRKDILVMNPGDHVHIDRRQRHRVEWTDPDQESVWLAIHYK